MPHERDERWVYVVLVILGIAFVAYTYRGSIDFSRISFDWAKKIGGMLPYAFATVFGVFYQLWNRKRLEGMRKKWEADIRAEGLLREGQGVRVAFAGGVRGSLKADVYLTRSALYVFDRGGRREPMRYPTAPSSPRDSVLADVALASDAAEGASTVQVQIRGRSPFVIELRAPDVEGWRTDLLRVLGRSVREAAREVPAEPEEAWGE